MIPPTADSRFPFRRPRQQLPGFLLLLLGLIVAVGATPWLSRNVPPALIAALPALVIGGFFLRKVPFPGTFPGTLGIVLGYVTLALAYKFLGKSTSELGYYFAEFKFLFVMLAMACAGPSLSKKQRLWLCVLAAGVLVANMADNVRLWKTLGRLYVTYFEGEGRASNVADTAFATAVMLGMGGVFLLALRARRAFLKWTSWALVLFFAYFLMFVAQRGITFFLGMAMLAFLALPATAFRAANAKKMALWSFSLLALLALFAGGGGEALLSGLASLVENSPRLQARISSVLVLLQGDSLDGSASSLSGRIGMIKTSLDAFLQSPATIMFGIGHHSSFDVVGNHSLVVDTFARYGLVGGVLFVVLLRRIYLTVLESAGISRSNPLMPKLKAFYVVFILRALVGDPFRDSVAVQLFVTAPLLVSLLAAPERPPAGPPGNHLRNTLHERS